MVASFGMCNASRKDLDNLSKFLLDALEAACYGDDKWIFELHVIKSHTINPKTTVFISTI